MKRILLAWVILSSACAADVALGTWEQLPIVTAAQHAAGIIPGGEGCQRIKALAIDSRDGNTLFIGTDVGGIFRSIDGGQRFAPANVGFTPRGAEAFAIDPQDPDRILGIGTYPEVFGTYHGIYRSTDRGATWTQVLACDNKDYSGGISVAWDPTGPNAYWAGPQGLWRSTDHGSTWAAVPNSRDLARSRIAIHPLSGSVYLANEHGLQRSVDGGLTFTTTLTTALTGLSVARAQPDRVWTCTEAGLLRSDDAGLTFTPIVSTVNLGPYKGLKYFNIAVSPADPQRIITNDRLHGFKYWSHDGGATWTRFTRDYSASAFDVKLHTDLAGDGQVVWHPTDPQRAWSAGVGDIVTATIDGGKNWTWANNGNAGLMLGSTFTFNAATPDTLYIGSQDYNGALTANGGATWEHVNLSRFRFGYVYGGYAAGPDLLFGGNGGHWGGKRKLFVMRGGNSPENVTDTGIELDGYPVCAGDPTAPNVLFAYNQRSPDRAATWSPMTGCDGVMTAMPSGTKALIGRNRKSLVSSIDHGATWTSLAELTSDISDVAVDTKRASFLVVAGEHLWRVTHGTPSDITNDIPADQFGNHRIITVAIDPQDPEIQYVGSRKDIYHYDGSVAMSHDGGATWSVITRSARLSVNNVGADGGGEPQWMRVHPQSHALYVGTNCYGMWRFNPKR